MERTSQRHKSQDTTTRSTASEGRTDRGDYSYTAAEIRVLAASTPYKSWTVTPGAVLRGHGPSQTSEVSSPPPTGPTKMNCFVSVNDTWDERLVIICWFYIKNYTFEHITYFLRDTSLSKDTFRRSLKTYFFALY